MHRRPTDERWSEQKEVTPKHIAMAEEDQLSKTQTLILMSIVAHTYHVNDLSESETERDIQRFGRVLRRSDPKVVVPHQVPHEFVLIVVCANNYNCTNKPAV